MDDIKTDNSNVIRDLINHIELCNFKIKEMQEDKQKSEALLKDLLRHTKDGSKRHEFENKIVIITTGYNHNVDVEKYLELRELVHPKYNPIKEIINYKVVDSIIRNCWLYGSNEDNVLLSKFIKTSEKKLHIKIENKELKDEEE